MISRRQPSFRGENGPAVIAGELAELIHAIIDHTLLIELAAEKVHIRRERPQLHRSRWQIAQDAPNLSREQPTVQTGNRRPARQRHDQWRHHGDLGLDAPGALDDVPDNIREMIESGNIDRQALMDTMEERFQDGFSFTQTQP